MKEKCKWGYYLILLHVKKEASRHVIISIDKLLIGSPYYIHGFRDGILKHISEMAVIYFAKHPKARYCTITGEMQYDQCENIEMRATVVTALVDGREFRKLIELYEGPIDEINRYPELAVTLSCK